MVPDEFSSTKSKVNMIVRLSGDVPCLTILEPPVVLGLTASHTIFLQIFYLDTECLICSNEIYFLLAMQASPQIEFLCKSLNHFLGLRILLPIAKLICNQAADCVLNWKDCVIGQCFPLGKSAYMFFY